MLSKICILGIFGLSIVELEGLSNQRESEIVAGSSARFLYDCSLNSIVQLLQKWLQ